MEGSTEEMTGRRKKGRRKARNEGRMEGRTKEMAERRKNGRKQEMSIGWKGVQKI